MSTSGKVALGLALALWVAGLWRITSAANSQLPPTRWTDFHTAAGPLEPPSWPHCHGPRFIDGERVWAFCDQSAPDGYRGAVRFDFAAGRAEMLWPMAFSDSLAITAFAPGPDRDTGGRETGGGDRFVAFRPLSEHGAEVVRLAATGGATPLGFPADTSAEGVIALAADADAVELVTGRWQPPAVHRRPLAGGDWTSTPVPPPPCPADTRCLVQAARRTPDGWELWAVRQPLVLPGDHFGPTTALLRRTPAGDWTVARELPAEPAAYRDGQLSDLLELERSVGGGVRFLAASEVPPLEWRDGAWTRFVAPTVAAARFEVPDFLVTDGALAWTPRLGTPRDAQRVRGRWLALRSDDGAYHLGSLDSRPGPALATDGWLGSQPALVPTADGGYVVLGAFGTYVRVDDELARTDAPGFFERVALLYDDFRRLTSYNDFFLELPALKMAAIPVVLGLLPVFAVVGLLARRRRWLAPLAGVYVVLAAAFLPWFWKLTGWI